MLPLALHYCRRRYYILVTVQYCGKVCAIQFAALACAIRNLGEARFILQRERMQIYAWCESVHVPYIPDLSRRLTPLSPSAALVRIVRN